MIVDEVPRFVSSSFFSFRSFAKINVILETKLCSDINICKHRTNKMIMMKSDFLWRRISSLSIMLCNVHSRYNIFKFKPYTIFVKSEHSTETTL